MDDFPDGVRFVDLSSIVDAAIVPTAVLTSLGGRDSSDQAPLEALLRRVQGRRLLLVLDNCEHLVDGCARLVETLLAASASLRVLATSREALRVAGEVAWRVPSLEIPDLATHYSRDQLLEYSSVKLFVDRVFQVDPDFLPGDGNILSAAQVCNRLDGIPLAIELAAGRASGMSIQEIWARLDDCFHLLTGGSRTALERHRTLRATIDWSHSLLTPVEQTLFRRLAVFAGGWTLEAAEAVCDGDPLPRSDILGTLMRLIDQSLVNFQTQDGRTRYRFLETVRVYADDELRAAGETSNLQARHRTWCVSFVERAAEGMLGPDQIRWFRLLTAEYDNVRAALDSCASEPDPAGAELRLAAAMGRFWWPRKPDEGRQRLAAALQRAPETPSSARAAALIWYALFELQYGHPARSRDLAHAALADARAVGDADRAASALRALVFTTDEDDAAGRVALLEEGMALMRAAGATPNLGALAQNIGYLGVVAAEAGDLARARALLEESDAMTRAAGDAWSQLATTTQLGWLALADDRLDEAEAQFRTLLDLATGWGHFHDAPGLVGLGQVSLRRGELEQARMVYRRLLVDLREFEPGSAHLADALVFLASVEEVAGLHQRAQRLLGANDAWHASRGGAGRTWRPATRTALKRGLVPIPPMPTDAALAHARVEGRSMSLEEAVAYALEPLEASPPDHDIAAVATGGADNPIVDVHA
jgi:non-specific serine/threonine protein kinase